MAPGVPSFGASVENKGDWRIRVIGGGCRASVHNGTVGLDGKS
jgi:hypothetical protein